MTDVHTRQGPASQTLSMMENYEEAQFLNRSDATSWEETRVKHMFLLESMPTDVTTEEVPKETKDDTRKAVKESELPKISKVLVDHGNVWTLQVDGSSTGRLGGIGIYLKSPEGVELDYVVTLDFKVTNNEVEYEALLIGMRIAKSLHVRKLKAYTDSQLVEAQFSGAFATKGPAMIKYLEILKQEGGRFEEFTLEKFAREWNERADALARFSSATAALDTRGIILLTVRNSSIMSPTTTVLALANGKDWMTDIFNYVKDESLPSDPKEARRIQCRANRYFVLGEDLYKKTFSGTHLRCLNPQEARTVLEEIHSGICGSHSGGRTLAQKIIRQGYY